MSSRTATARQRLQEPLKPPSSAPNLKLADPSLLFAESAQLASLDNHQVDSRTPRSQNVVLIGSSELQPSRNGQTPQDVHYSAREVRSENVELKLTGLYGVKNAQNNSSQQSPHSQDNALPLAAQSIPSFVNGRQWPNPTTDRIPYNSQSPPKWGSPSLDPFPLPPPYPPPCPTTFVGKFVPPHPTTLPQPSQHPQISLPTPLGTPVIHADHARFPHRSSPNSQPGTRSIGISTPPPAQMIMQHDPMARFKRSWPMVDGDPPSISIPNSGGVPRNDDFTATESTSSLPLSPSGRLPVSSLRRNSLSPELSLGSGSSEASLASGDSHRTQSPAFIFPGSRSVARPKKLPKANGSGVKTRARSKSRGRRSLDERTVPSLGTSLTAPVNLPQFVVTPAEQTPRVFITETVPSTRTSNHASGASNANTLTVESPPATPTAFIFPGSRSRARPSTESKNKSMAKKGSRKRSGDAHVTDQSTRTKLMGKFLPKKKEVRVGRSSMSDSASSKSISSGDLTLSPSSNQLSFAESIHDSTPASVPIPVETQEHVREMKSRIGAYPFDPYDLTLLDDDRHTAELLLKLNPTGSPSFHDYGNTPPRNVLDLGCGQGHWVIETAIFWKEFGTKVTGYDMVDISKGLLPWAIKEGVDANIRFCRGNFLKQRLPFPNDSFDLVRMSCLALCVPSNYWITLLQEVRRVLAVGGRIELIDDEPMFPYANTQLNINELAAPFPPTLDISIPSARMSSFSMAEALSQSLHLGRPIGPTHRGLHQLSQAGEGDSDSDDTATLNFDLHSRYVSQTPDSRLREAPDITAIRHSIGQQAWNAASAVSHDLEALFDHMLVYKFGIDMITIKALPEMMTQVFGFVRELETMHLTLGPSGPPFEAGGGKRGRQAKGFNGTRLSTASKTSSASRRQPMGLDHISGLILWPSTFLPMDPSEIEIHASKHFRMLLSCKNMLIEHAAEAVDDQEIDEESISEALWEYEGFLQHRMIIPHAEQEFSEEADQFSDTASIHGSIAESVTSENLDAMWDLDREFRERYVWPPWRPTLQDSRPTSPEAASVTDSTRPSLDTSSTLTLPSAPLEQSKYLQSNRTHIRTFRVYDAVKIDVNHMGVRTR